MKFEELKNSLKSKIADAYLLSGSDEFLLTSAYNLIVKYSGVEFHDLNIIKFSEGVIDCKDIVRALDTMPVFSNKKIVCLDIRMSKKSEIKNIQDINDYLSNPNSGAILVVNEGSNDVDFGLKKEYLTIVDCNKLDIKIVSAKVMATFQKNQKVASQDTINMLYDYCLGDLSKILVECDKLVSFVGERGEITKKDIQEIVSPSLEYQIFELTEALAKKNSDKVYTILNDMKAKKDEYKTVPALIYSHFRRLFMVSLNKSDSNAEVAKMLGVKEYAVKMIMKQVGLFSKSNLKKINELCINLDYDLKQSNISIDNAINLVVLQILNM